MSENENKRELDELEVEGVVGGKRLVRPKDGSKEECLGKVVARESDTEAKKKDVYRPLPFPQDRRGNK